MKIDCTPLGGRNRFREVETLSNPALAKLAVPWGISPLWVAAVLPLLLLVGQIPVQISLLLLTLLGSSTRRHLRGC